MCQRTLWRNMVDFLSLQECDQIFLVFPYHCPNKFLLHHTYAMKGPYKMFALQGSFVAILLTNEAVVLVRQTFRLPWNQEVTFFISWSCEVVSWNYLYSELFNGELSTPAFRLYLHICQQQKQTHQKAAHKF